MNIRFRRIMTFFLCLILVSIPEAFSKDHSKILKFFESHSIPVDEIKVEEKAVAARINYGVDFEINEEKMETHIIAVSKKLAEEFSKSETIRLQYCVEGEEIYALDFATKDVKDGLKGKKTDEDILGAMEIKMSGREEGGEGGGVGVGEGVGGGGDGSSQGMQNLGDGKVSFLGVSLTRPEEKEIRVTDVLEDSPAEHAGLKIGDKILQMEEYESQDIGNDSWKLLEHLQEMPFDRPIRFRIERDKKGFDVWVKLERMEKERLDKILEARRPVLNSDLVKGKQFLGQNKFAEAVESFKKSLKSNPMESYQGLGICYYHMEKFKEARKNIEKAYKLDRTVPLNVFYTAACRDVVGKTNTAKFHYEEYLAMNHDNAEMNEFAKKRIEALKARKRKKTSESFVKLLDAIIKEIK